MLIKLFNKLIQKRKGDIMKITPINRFNQFNQINLPIPKEGYDKFHSYLANSMLATQIKVKQVIERYDYFSPFSAININNTSKFSKLI